MLPKKEKFNIFAILSKETKIRIVAKRQLFCYYKNKNI
jgi:hypothetical protein